MKVVVITGANRGLGLGIARIFHQSGWIVVGLNRTFCKEDWMKEIYCDVSNLSSIQKAIDQVIDLYQRIDIVVCNAGVGIFLPFISYLKKNGKRV